MRATEHAPRGPLHILEHLYGLAEIVERGIGVSVERLRVIRPTRVWRLGAPLPRYVTGPPAPGIVLDAKLFVTNFRSMEVYDPQVDTWTREEIPWRHNVEHAYTHNGRIFVFSRDGTGLQRASDGSWSPYGKIREFYWRTSGYEPGKSESVILG